MSRIFATLGILFLFSCISAASKIPGGFHLVIDIIYEGSCQFQIDRLNADNDTVLKEDKCEDSLKEPDYQTYV